MHFAAVLLLLLGLASDEPEGAQALRERLLKLHRGDALEYTMYRDASRSEKLEFRTEPVYVWTNPVRSSQDGAVFIWTSRGRTEAIATIFSSAGGGQRGVTHEFHSLSLSTLATTRRGVHKHLWEPKGPGIALAPIGRDAPRPATAAAQRLIQMRSLAREFTAHTHDAKNNRWELRLLPQPLYRYESTDPDVPDGALFAFVTSAGTDPEAILVIEERQPPGGGTPVWHRAIARFTDMHLSVRYNGEEVFSAPLIRGKPLDLYPKQEYGIYADRVIPEGPVAAVEGAKR